MINKKEIVGTTKILTRVRIPLLILVLGLLTICTASAFTVVFSGGDLVRNGGFYTDTGWTKIGNVTVGSGTANFNVVDWGAYIYQGISDIRGKKIRVSFDITSYTSGSVRVYSFATPVTVGTPKSGVGTYSEVITISPGSGNANISLRSYTSGFIGSVDNFSVQEIKESSKITRDTDLSGTSGLVAAYNFIPDGASLPDISGEGNTGTITGATLVSDGMNFDGVNDYVNILTNDNLNFGTSSFNVKFRGILSPSETRTPAIGKRLSAAFGTSAGWQIFPNVSSNLIYLMVDDGSNYIYSSSGFSADNFVHSFSLNVDRVNNLAYFYKDGIKGTEINISAITGSVSNSAPLRISNVQNGWFLGELEDLRLGNYAITAQEAKAYHNSFAKSKLSYSPQKIGDWTLAKSDQQSDTRSLLNSSAGTSYIPSTQAYGKWEFDMYKGDTENTSYIQFIAPTSDFNVGTSIGGYDFRLGNDESLKLVRTASVGLLETDSSYIDIDTWYRIKVERTGTGIFTIYIKGGDFGDDYVLVDVTGGSGTNPVTDNTYTTSAYMVANLDAGDAIRGVWKTDTGGFPVTDFVDGTGTTSITGNIVVNDKSTGQNHGTWTGESRLGKYITFDGVDDKVDTGTDMIGTDAVTVMAWVKTYSLGENNYGRILDNGRALLFVSGTAYIFISDASTSASAGSGSLEFNKWQFVTATRTSAGTSNFYIGDLDTPPALSGSADQASGTPATGTTNVIIGNNDAQTRTFDGAIANVRIFDKVLTTSEIAQQYQQTKPVTKWVKIGDQVWMQDYMNVGTKIDDPGSTAIAVACAGDNVETVQTIEGVECYCISRTIASCQRSGIGGTTQKYCYNNDEANCTTDGALYEWQEAMDLPAECAYTDCSAQINTPHQGICPNGWHIPTDTEWKTLEGQLGMSTAVQDAEGWRGTKEGDKLKTVDKCFGSSNCSTSGFSALLAGYRNVSGGFYSSGSYAYVWSSSQDSSSSAWSRYLTSGYSTVGRRTYYKGVGFSLRCLKD